MSLETQHNILCTATHPGLKLLLHHNYMIWIATQSWFCMLYWYSTELSNLNIHKNTEIAKKKKKNKKSQLAFTPSPCKSHWIVTYCCAGTPLYDMKSTRRWETCGKELGFISHLFSFQEISRFSSFQEISTFLALYLLRITGSSVSVYTLTCNP